MTDLDGRCGTCSFYVPMERTEAGGWVGECRLGRGAWPLPETATCSSYKAKGSSWSGWKKSQRKAQSIGRRAPVERDPRPEIPKELGIDMDQDEFRTVLREVILDELGIRDVEIGDRWQGGELIIKPGKDDTQDKRVPLDNFFKKIVMVRDKLRVLEQKVNASKSLSSDEKVQLQQYITGCYGSLTTFNVLFRDKDDHFKGQSTKE